MPGKDIQPKQITATELDVYKYIIDRTFEVDDRTERNKFLREKLDHIFAVGSQSRACLVAAALYARSFLAPYGEVLHIMRTRVRQIPEIYGKLTNEELHVQRVQNLNDGPLA